MMTLKFRFTGILFLALIIGLSVADEMESTSLKTVPQSSTPILSSAPAATTPVSSSKASISSKAPTSTMETSSQNPSKTVSPSTSISSTSVSSSTKVASSTKVHPSSSTTKTSSILPTSASTPATKTAHSTAVVHSTKSTKLPPVKTSTVSKSVSPAKPTPSHGTPQPVVIIKYECGDECKVLRRKVWAAGFFAVFFAFVIVGLLLYRSNRCSRRTYADGPYSQF